MSAQPVGERADQDPTEVHRDLALKAAVAGESFLVPIELATILAVGGERGIDETAAMWLAMLEHEPAKGLGKAGVGVVDRCVAMFSLEDEVKSVTLELVRAQPAPPAAVEGWREFELGQRAQVLLLLAHLVARRLPKPPSDRATGTSPRNPSDRPAVTDGDAATASRRKRRR
jgi:hypothetical protein